MANQERERGTDLRTSERYHSSVFSRLRRRLSQRIVGGIMTTTLAANTIPFESFPIAETRIHRDLPGQGDNYLYPITDPRWDITAEVIKTEGNDSNAIPATARVVNGSFVIKYTSTIVPEEYKRAFEDTLTHPILQTAARDKVVDVGMIEPSTKDNGYFLPQMRNQYGVNDENELAFQISDGQGKPEERTYFDRRIFTAIGIHEVGHAYGWSWEKYLLHNTTPEDPVLARKLDAIVNAYTDIRNDAFRKFIDHNRDEVALAFDKTANNFYKTARRKGNDAFGQEVDTLLLADDLAMTADKVRSDSPDIYNILTKRNDSWGIVLDMPFFVDDVDDKNLRLYSLQRETTPLYKVNADLNKRGRELFTCINDESFIKDMIKTNSSINSGHSYEYLNEFFPSLLALLALNPTFLPKCMERESPDNRARLQALIGSVLAIEAYVHPELFATLRKDPNADRIIAAYIS